MGYFYFDDSVHDRGGFVLGAYVYTSIDIQSRLETALLASGFAPGINEFKSSAHMGRNPKQAELRDALNEILRSCRLGLVVVPRSDRDFLGREALICLAKILRQNNLSDEACSVYLDRSIFPSTNAAAALASKMGFDANVNFHFEQDSREVLGIQLADLAAHTCSTMLLEALGIVTKTIKAGENTGYDPDLDIDLGFWMWAGIRRNFFSGDFQRQREEWETESSVRDVSSYGLHIAESCNEQLREATQVRFGSMYLGCIHG